MLWQSNPAREYLMGRETTGNPTPAASFLLGMSVRRPTLWSAGRARRYLRKRTRTGNPLPAALSVLGGGLKLGAARDPKKMKERAAKLQLVINKAMAGEESALEQLQLVSQGLAWPGGWAQLRQMAADALALASQKQETKAAARRSVAEAASAREGRFLEAGTQISGAFASALGRSSRSLPRRKRRRRRTSTAYY